MRTEATYPAGPSSVTSARHLVTDLIRPLPEAAQDRIVMMVSEITTNAVVHARTEFHISVDVGDAVVTVEVRDSGRSGHPVARDAAPSDMHGRGLRIVEALADDWGVETRNDGSTVWFTVALAD